MKRNIITLGHGSGGELTNKLISEMILPKHKNLTLDDAAIINIEGAKLAFTTDSFVVNPYFFPGGDIGKLAVFGSVNDLAVQGAIPLYISTSIVLEEGFNIDELEIILQSIADSADMAGVCVVAGDTKVVEKGACDKIFINTAAIGKAIHTNMDRNRINVGDKIIITGEIGMHSMAVMSKRYEFNVSQDMLSDCDELASMTMDLIKNCGDGIKWMRDPTRGGIAAVLNELVQDKEFVVEVDENKIPTSKTAEAIAEMLGIDLLNAACEGVAVIVVDGDFAESALKIARKHRQGENAAIAGTIIRKEQSGGMVLIKTKLGMRRIVLMPSGEQLPRIC